MDKAKIHSDLCDSLSLTYVRKNHDYGDAYSEIRKEYSNLVLVHLSEKLSRLKTLMGHEDTAQVDESINDTLMDLANYCLLEMTERIADEGIHSEVHGVPHED